VTVTIFDEALHGITAVLVECNSRSEDPDDVAMVTIMTKDVVEVVIMAGERRLSCAPGTKGELICVFFRWGLKTPNMNVNALFSMFSPSNDHLIALANPTSLDDIDRDPIQDHHRIHAAFRSEHPVPVTQVNILRMI
jgi:hypothetical protein